MKHVRVLSTALLAAASMASVQFAGAQSTAGPGPGSSMTPAERHDWERSHRMSKIIGTDVRTKAGEKIGEIKDLVVDNNGNVRLAIVSTGGFLGVGDRMHAVPWDALTLGPKDDRILDIDKNHLMKTPGFTSKTWPNLGDDRWMADNRRYYIR
jgi:sporulation protein YlmC with PRC-barrel domain